MIGAMSRRVYLETFGCQMNELDSELVSGQLRALGYTFTPDRDLADVVLYNTCSVREHAEQKVWSRLGELKERKIANPGLVVGVMGCLAERDGVALLQRMPVVDVLVGPGELDKLPGLLENAVKTNISLLESDGPLESESDLRSARQIALQGSASRRSATLAAAQDTLELLDLSRSMAPREEDAGVAPRSAYVRITRGCNKFCTYCVVPFTRGAEVHRPPAHIIEECKRLAGSGVIEVTLLGQTVNHYRFEHGAAVTLDGITQPQKGRTYAGGHNRDPFTGANVTTFADLLRQIHDEVPAIQRLRFVTSYPRDFGDDVLEVMRDHPRICRYLHVPAQTGSNRLLKLMNRGYEVQEYLEFLDRARAHLDTKERPLELSGDFIVGFPTETDADFEATLDLVHKAQYKNAFIFKYSPRPGTIAFDKLPDDVPEAVKRERNQRLLAAQGDISQARSQRYIGQTLAVFVEGFSMRERKMRSRASAAGTGGVKAGNGPGTVALTIGGLAAGASRTPAGALVSEAPVSEDDGCGVHHIHGAGAHGSASPAARTDPAVQAQFSARTDTDVIVLFDAPEQFSQGNHLGQGNLVGSIVQVRINGASGLSLSGELVR
jgi:tRNA-2-methylthio-N6-dimethylallyladenosine synthase